MPWYRNYVRKIAEHTYTDRYVMMAVVLQYDEYWERNRGYCTIAPTNAWCWHAKHQFYASYRYQRFESMLSEIQRKSVFDVANLNDDWSCASEEKSPPHRPRGTTQLEARLWEAAQKGGIRFHMLSNLFWRTLNRYLRNRRRIKLKNTEIFINSLWTLFP